MSWIRRPTEPSERTISVSEFISFLFRSQLVDPPTNEHNSELQGMSGMMLRTFRESPRDEEESAYAYTTRSSLNRSRFSSEYTRFERRSDNTEVPSSPASTSSTVGGGSGWRVYGHSRQSSTSSSDSTHPA